MSHNSSPAKTRSHIDHHSTDDSTSHLQSPARSPTPNQDQSQSPYNTDTTMEPYPMDQEQQVPTPFQDLFDSLKNAATRNVSIS